MTRTRRRRRSCVLQKGSSQMSQQSSAAGGSSRSSSSPRRKNKKRSASSSSSPPTKKHKTTSSSSATLHSDLAWDAQFARLVNYQNTHGDTLVPLHYDKDSVLSAWVVQQREAYSKRRMRPDHLHRLLRINFAFGVNNKGEPIICGGGSDPQYDAYQFVLPKEDGAAVDDESEEEEQLLEESAESEEEEESETELSDGKPFAKRVASDSMDEDSESDDSQDDSVYPSCGKTAWEDFFQRLLKYREEHGDTLVPQRYEIDRALGAFVADTRRLYKLKRLAEPLVARLNSIGFVWAPSRAQISKQQSKSVASSKERKDNQKDPTAAVMADDKKSKSFSRPATEGRARSKDYWVDDDLEEEPEESAESEGEETDSENYDGKPIAKHVASDSMDEDSDSDDSVDDSAYPFCGKDAWEDFFLRLSKYRENHGDTLVPRRYEIDQALSRFVFDTRRLYKLKRLAKPLVARMNSIGFVWYVSRAQINERISHAARSKERKDKPKSSIAAVMPADKTRKESVLRPVINEDTIAKRNKHTAQPSNTSTHDKIIALLPPAKPVSDPAFSYMLKRLKKFIQVHGNAYVPQKGIDKELGRWVSSQRKRLRKQTLRQDQFRQLVALDFVWAMDRAQRPIPIQLDFLDEGDLLMSPEQPGTKEQNKTDSSEDDNSETDSEPEKVPGQQVKQAKRYQRNKSREYEDDNASDSDEEKKRKFFRHPATKERATSKGNKHSTQASITSIHDKIIALLPPAIPGSDPGFSDMLKCLKKYVQEYGNASVPQMYRDGVLGRWVKKQRERLKKQTLRQDEFRQLVALDFVWAMDRLQRPIPVQLDFLDEGDLLISPEQPDTRGRNKNVSVGEGGNETDGEPMNQQVKRARRRQSSRESEYNPSFSTTPKRSGAPQSVTHQTLTSRFVSLLQLEKGSKIPYKQEITCLKQLVDVFCRNPLVKKYIGKPFCQLFPELAGLHAQVVTNPNDLGSIRERLSNKEFEYDLDVMMETCTVFDQSIAVFSSPLLNDGHSLLSVIEHLKDYFIMLWQEYMLDSSPVPEVLSLRKLQDLRSTSRAHRLQLSSPLAITRELAGYLSYKLDQLVESGFKMTQRYERNPFVGAPVVGIRTKFERLSAKLAELAKGESYSYTLEEFHREIFACIPKSLPDSDYMADQLSVFFWRTVTPIHEANIRGVDNSSIWGDFVTTLWARDGPKKPYWPALCLGVVAPPDLREDWHSMICERNEARLPAAIRSQIVVGRRRAEQAVGKQSGCYFLVEFLGTHEFAWAKSSNVKQFDPSDDPYEGIPPSLIQKRQKAYLPLALEEAAKIEAEYELNLKSICMADGLSEDYLSVLKNRYEKKKEDPPSSCTCNVLFDGLNVMRFEGSVEATFDDLRKEICEPTSGVRSKLPQDFRFVHPELGNVSIKLESTFRLVDLGVETKDGLLDVFVMDYTDLTKK